MSKSLAAIRAKNGMDEREKAIQRRLKEGRGGLGYWAAVDARQKEANMKQEPKI